MERNINKKVEQYQVEFKNDIKKWLQSESAKITSSKGTDDLTSKFLQFIFDYNSLSFNKDDFQKRKRIKNIVPSNDLCIAKRANGEQCTRRKKDETCDFCGTHIKGTPHGEINSNVDDKAKIISKVDIWVQEIKGINYYIDSLNNVYKPEDIISNKQNPAVIAKWSLTDAGVYKIPLFGI